MKISSNFKELNRKHIIEDYNKARRRLILLDYEGTLPSCTLLNSEYNSKGSYPSKKVLSILEDLTKDKRNTIFIVTGREEKLVSDWFSSTLTF
jgi:trehalose 6-phosphate synthase/phosphatase